MFLNDNIWLATFFALALLMAIFGLLFLLAWMEPARPAQRAPGRTRAAVPKVGASRS